MIETERARIGARALAAAVTLTGLNVIRLPNGRAGVERLDPAAVLAGWSAKEVDALLRTGIFDDVVYGSVRFRHREIRELLTAEWALDLLAKPGGRAAVEALFFRSVYGEDVLVARMRPVLAWLILFDDNVRDRALRLEPELATEGGDPSRLPFEVRRAILLDIVGRIAGKGEVMPLMDNGAIARLAAPDLAEDAQALLAEHGENDDVVFFLGRFAWQGQIADCIPYLLDVACNPARGLYARIAAIRAVMNVGDAAQQNELWAAIADHPGPLDRRLLAELLDSAPASEASIRILLRTIDRLEPYGRFQATGLTQALYGFVDRLPVMSDAAADQPLASFVAGLTEFLDREPYIERAECHVSEAFAWLMGPALHAVERLVSSRAVAALGPAPGGVLQNVPALRFWRGEDISDYRSKLGELVPRWRELNDALYWATVRERRLVVAEKGERLTDDWQVAMLGHFWQFGPLDFNRCLAWVVERPDVDDRLVALSRCFALYVGKDRPTDWRQQLIDACTGQPEFEAALDVMLNPPPSPAREEWETRHRARERKHARIQRKQERERAAWVERLRADPDRVRHPEGLEPGQLSNDQFHLMQSVGRDGESLDRDMGVDWRSLIAEFGKAVAEAYRDAAVAHWRAYVPALRSEGADTGSTPYSLIFAMAGIAIEADEDQGFYAGLSADDARHAFRYVTWELNGFPRWFEPLYRAHPEIGFEAVVKELTWELENSRADTTLNYMLHDILYHAPWLHADVAPMILRWLLDHDVPSFDGLRYSIDILLGGRIGVEQLATVAATKSAAAGAEHSPRWFALWVDTDPDAAVPALEAYLAAVDLAAASNFAQQFVIALLGGRRGEGSRIGAFRTADHLKRLYVLMHRYIRSAEDIDRANKGVYSPTMRDDAQDARNRLFGLLSEVPGGATYAAIKALEEEHPDPSYRRWMAHRARERAIKDADEPAWSAGQFASFSKRFAGSD